MAYSRRSCNEHDRAAPDARWSDGSAAIAGRHRAAQGGAGGAVAGRRLHPGIVRIAAAGRRSGHRRLAALQPERAGDGDGGAAPRLRPERADGGGARERQHHVGELGRARRRAFAQANIYARASGYISKRNVDIGSQVKAGDLLVEITAPELDHQIAQAEGTLAQMQASLQQAKAKRDLAQVTWDRDNPLVQKGWVTAQQGDTDRLTLQARASRGRRRASQYRGTEGATAGAQSAESLSKRGGAFNGVITQRNIDIGSLVQADATSGTFLFTLMQSDVIRIQLYVPQDEAFGVAPGVEAIVRVPEMPGRDFPGKVTRIADALQPGTRTLLTEIDVPNPDHALQPGHLLHRRTENPAQDAVADRAVGGDHLQPRGAQRRGGRGRRRAHPPRQRWCAISAPRSR